MFPLSHIYLLPSVKLNHSNYSIWKAQALPYFYGQGVFSYLDGTIQIPPQEIDAPHPTTCAITKIPNLEYDHWLRQDSLILATINTVITQFLTIFILLLLLLFLLKNDNKKNDDEKQKNKKMKNKLKLG
jgi:hypothetical protein